MIRQINDDLYQILCGWWEARGVPALTKDLLGTQGYAYFLDDKPIIAGFLYKAENSSFGMVEWIVSSPESTREQRNLGFKELMDRLLAEAKEAKIRLLMTTVKHHSLMKRMEGEGFFQDTQNVTQMFREV